MEKNYKHLTLAECDRMMEMLFEGRKRTKIPDRVSIEERAESVETRKEIGHWEGDSVYPGRAKRL